MTNPSISLAHRGDESLAMNPILSALKYWLVDHPTILHFSWKPGSTFGSSPHFLILTLLTYLIFTFLLPRTSLPCFLAPQILKPITAIHSLTLFLLSSVMAVGCLLSIIFHSHDFRHIICFPPGTKPSGPLFFWAYIFYLSKILEFIDTLMIILGNATKRLTFLHVYHHTTVVLMCYLWLSTRQSLFPIALETNSVVHVLMYYYYLSCAMGERPRWKRLVTDCQILQFLFSFCLSGWMLYYHFRGSGCSGIWGWCFNAVFNASLLALFLDFHSKIYAHKNKV